MTKNIDLFHDILKNYLDVPVSIYTILPKVLGLLFLIKGLTTLVISMSRNINV